MLEKNYRSCIKTKEATNSDVKELVTKQLKDAPKRKGREEKQNLKDRTDVTNVNKNLNPPMKQKLTVLKILHYRTAM